MDKIWKETLARLDALEKRVFSEQEHREAKEAIEGQKPATYRKFEDSETFPEQQHREAEEAIEGHKPDRKFENGAEVTK